MRRLYHASLLRALGVVVLLVATLFAPPLGSAMLGPRAAFAQHEPEPPPAVPSAPPAAPSHVVAPLLAESAKPPPPAPRTGPTAEVRVRDKVVFIFRADRAGRTAQERARAANTAIEALISH